MKIWPFNNPPRAIEGTKAREEPTISRRPRQRGAHGRRGFEAARHDRLAARWFGDSRPIDEILRGELVAMRRRSRDLAMNEDYTRGYLRMVSRNLVGSAGVALKWEAKDPDGELDTGANETLLEGWKDWGQVGVCTVDGELSWSDVERLAVRTAARDGDFLVRLVRGFDNPFRFALQILPAESLPESMYRDLPNGNRVRMGIETDKWKRPVAYHIQNRDARGQTRVERVPAEEIIHLYYSDDPDQTRGMPWMYSAMRRIRHIGEYEKTALVAARVGAAKMGFYKQDPEGQGYAPPASGEVEGEAGAPELAQEVEPGTFEILPVGVEMQQYDAKYPDGDMPDFIKLMLRGGATGLGVSYNSWANDLEGVNFSSLRAGLLEERDEWATLQQWLISRLHKRVVVAWLEQALLAGAVALPLAGFDKFNRPRWFPRRWQWVDPDKEGKANARDVTMGVTSRTRIAAERGRDLREVIEEQKEELALFEAAGIKLGDASAADPQPVIVENQDDN